MTKISNLTFIGLAITVAVVTLMALFVSAQAAEEPLVTIDPPGSVDTRPFGISPSGDIVGLYITADGATHGFLLSAGEYTAIDVPGAIRANALAINARGDIVGRYDIGAVAHGYILRDGIFTTIDFPGAAGFSVLTDIDAAGRVVGRYRGSDGKFHGFLLADGIFTTIWMPTATPTWVHRESREWLSVQPELLLVTIRISAVRFTLSCWIRVFTPP
jgi:hypothetical protein